MKIKGRKTEFDPREASIVAHVYEEEVVIHIDDASNDEFWLHITLTEQDLRELLACIESYQLPNLEDALCVILAKKPNEQQHE